MSSNTIDAIIAKSKLISENDKLIYEKGKKEIISSSEILKAEDNGKVLIIDNMSDIITDNEVLVKYTNFQGLLEGCTFEEVYFEYLDAHYIRSSPFDIPEDGNYTLALKLKDNSKFSDLDISDSDWNASYPPTSYYASVNETQRLTAAQNQRVFLSCNSGLTVDDIISATIEIGDNVIAPEEPDLSQISLKMNGKNLFDKEAWIDYCNSISNEEAISNDNYLGEECFSYELNKKGSGQPPFTDVKFKENTQYTFSAEFSFSDKHTTGDLDYTVLTIGFANGGYEYLKGKASRNRFQKISYTTSKNRSIAFITFSWYGPGRRTYCKWLQIEEGTTATEFEEYKTKTYQLNSNGIISNVEFFTPVTTLSTNNDNINITAKYTKDLNTTYNNYLTQIALSGGE